MFRFYRTIIVGYYYSFTYNNNKVCLFCFVIAETITRPRIKGSGWQSDYFLAGVSLHGVCRKAYCNDIGPARSCLCLELCGSASAI